MSLPCQRVPADPCRAPSRPVASAAADRPNCHSVHASRPLSHAGSTRQAGGNRAPQVSRGHSFSGDHPIRQKNARTFGSRRRPGLASLGGSRAGNRHGFALSGPVCLHPFSAVHPLSRPVTPEVAGSSPVAPVENILQTSIFCCLYWRDRPPAFRPVTRSSRTRSRTRSGQSKALQIAMFCGGHAVRLLGHSAAIPQANRPAVLGGADTNGLKRRLVLAGVSSRPVVKVVLGAGRGSGLCGRPSGCRTQRSSGELADEVQRRGRGDGGRLLSGARRRRRWPRASQLAELEDDVPGRR